MVTSFVEETVYLGLRGDGVAEGNVGNSTITTGRMGLPMLFTTPLADSPYCPSPVEVELASDCGFMLAESEVTGVGG